MAYNFRTYFKEVKGHMANLPNFKHFDSTAWLVYKNAFHMFGLKLPSINRAPRILADADFVTEQLTNIMGNDFASIRVLRRLSGVFLVRVYIKKILVGRTMEPKTAFIVMGEKMQVAMVRRIWTHIEYMYTNLVKNRDFMRVMAKQGNSYGPNTLRNLILNHVIECMEKWPSYRPGNKNHQSSVRTLRTTHKAYKEYEFRLFLFTIKLFKFEYRNKRKHPQYRVKPLKQAEWKLISDLRDFQGYKSLVNKEQIKYGWVIWPGRC